MKKVLYVASESAPFVKTGGLGSVLGSLPREINQKKYDVSLVIPAYECIKEPWKSRMKELFVIPVSLGWRKQQARILTLNYEGICCYFIGNDTYFCGDSPYSDIWMDIEKFCFFTKAVLEMISYLDYEPDLIHCHDWQTGMLPVYLNFWYKKSPFYRNIKTIMTIHNLKFQGITEIGRMKDITGLPDEAFTFDKLEFYGNANMLKGGIACADWITTVSESYAKEILSDEYGEGLAPSLKERERCLSGIVNGIDYKVYNPSEDPWIEQTYTVRTAKKKRKINKTALQQFANMVEDERAFTIGIVSRLTDQKGYELLDKTMDPLFEKGAQLYVLGAGEPAVEKIFEDYCEKYPNQVYFNRCYEDKIAKYIYAGCDVTLMPSRFEPCGLNQLMALRYGCVPVVRETGGLKDTVSECVPEEKKGTGFLFEPYDKDALLETLLRAYSLYEGDENSWKEMQERGMRKNYSWKTSARIYEKLYKALIDQKECTKRVQKKRKV